MDIDGIINDVIMDNAAGGADIENLEQMPIEKLLGLNLNNEQVQTAIYKKFKSAAIDYIDAFTDSPACKDIKADKGMFACSQDTFSACIREFGIDYFQKYKYLHDVARERSEGGKRLNDILICIGLEVFETLCELYHKSFQVAECSYFLGINKDNIYKLNELHSSYLKNAHFAAENNMRLGAISNRGNVTGYIMLMNHDYNYTRTTEIIHTSSSDRIAADRLPTLEDRTQDIVFDVGSSTTDGL